MKTIALLYDSILDFGGVESHILSILEKIDRSQYSFLVISRCSPKFLERIEAFGAEAVPIKQRHPLNLFTPIQLSKIIKKKKVDIIHSHSPTASLWGRIAAYLTGKPFIATVHLPVNQYHGNLNNFRSRKGKWIYSALDRFLNHSQAFTTTIIYVAEQVYRREIETGHSPETRSILIPNGVDIDKITRIQREEARHHFNLLPDHKIILFVGRLEAQKGVDILLEAVSMLDLAEYNIRLWLVGEGSLFDVLERRAQNSGLADMVTFWGYQENIPVFLKASDIFVLPSRFESMPIALLEAMAAELPCVVARVGEMDGLIEDQTHGLVLPSQNAVKLRDAIISLLQDPKISNQYAVNAALRARRFSDVVMVKQIEQVYTACLKSSHYNA